MEWIESQLRMWWIFLPLCWLAGFVFFLIKRDTRAEAVEYWDKLKNVAFLTFLATAMGLILIAIPLGVLGVLGWSG